MGNISALLVVKDLKASLDFYVNLLGFTLEERNEDSIKLSCDQHTVIIFQGTMMSVEYEHGYNSNSTLLITVTDLDKKIAELKSKGVIFIHTTPNGNKWGRYAAFKDPSGIVHELFQLHN